MHRIVCASLVALVLANLAGCAGFRGGWQSVAYVDTPPAAAEVTSLNRYDAPTLMFPGLKLQATLDNESRTYDTAIYFGLPLSIDPRTTYPGNVEPGKTRVFLNVVPSASGFTFRPADAQLSVAGRTVAGSAGYEFGMWMPGWQRVESGGKWEHRPVGAAMQLTEPGRSYVLSIDFVVPVPSPESHGITLDLSRALVSATHPALPVIRFAPMRWKEGYQ